MATQPDPEPIGVPPPDTIQPQSPPSRLPPLPLMKLLRANRPNSCRRSLILTSRIGPSRNCRRIECISSVYSCSSEKFSPSPMLDRPLQA